MNLSCHTVNCSHLHTIAIEWHRVSRYGMSSYHIAGFIAFCTGCSRTCLCISWRAIGLLISWDKELFEGSVHLLPTNRLIEPLLLIAIYTWPVLCEPPAFISSTVGTTIEVRCLLLWIRRCRSTIVFMIAFLSVRYELFGKFDASWLAFNHVGHMWLLKMCTSQGYEVTGLHINNPLRSLIL